MPHLAMLTQLALDFNGLAFDPFFRGLLSVLAGVVVLMGSIYLIVATNAGTRQGLLIALSGLFGWMMLMGVAWTIYGIGWKGRTPAWELVEINYDQKNVQTDGLLYSAIGDVSELVGPNGLPAAGLGGLTFNQNDVLNSITDAKEKATAATKLQGTSTVSSVSDPDLAQQAALDASRQLQTGKWRYLSTSNPIRGEAQASVDAFLVADKVFGNSTTTSSYVPEQFGAFFLDGKPPLKDNPNVFDRVWHTVDETVFHPWFNHEFIVMQVRGAQKQVTLPGQPPPVAKVDPNAPLVSIIMERNREGPMPAFFSGLRFTPAMFTVFSGLIFALLAFNLHVRDKREAEIRAAAG